MWVKYIHNWYTLNIHILYISYLTNIFIYIYYICSYLNHLINPTSLWSRCYYYNLSILSRFTLYLIVPTSVEFITGYLLLKVFNERYWDYSSLKFNYKGLITLKFSIYWSILCYIGIRLIAPIINNFYLSLENLFRISNIFILLIMTIDFIYTINIKFNIKKTRLLNS